MGKAERRVNPKIVCRVERNLFRLVLGALPELLKKMSDPWKKNKRGRPCYEPKVVAAINFLAEFFGYTYNEAESNLSKNEEVKRAFGATKLPGHSVLHRGRKRLSMAWLMRLHFLVISEVQQRDNKILDATGISKRIRSRAYNFLLKRATPKDFLHLFLAVSHKSGVIENFKVTAKRTHDSKKTRPLLRPLNFNFVTADAANFSRKNLEYILSRRGIPIIKPKGNLRRRTRGFRIPKAILDFLFSPVFKLLYRVRPFIEGTVSALKRKFGDFVRAIKARMQCKEIALRIISYNLKRVLYIKEAERLGESPWVYC